MVDHREDLNTSSYSFMSPLSVSIKKLDFFHDLHNINSINNFRNSPEFPESFPELAIFFPEFPECFPELPIFFVVTYAVD